MGEDRLSRTACIRGSSHAAALGESWRVTSCGDIEIDDFGAVKYRQANVQIGRMTEIREHWSGSVAEGLGVGRKLAELEHQGAELETDDSSLEHSCTHEFGPYPMHGRLG